MKERIVSCLPGDYPWADRLHYFPTIGSTNDTLKNLARQGAPHGTALVAGHQTCGHGRLGRKFHAPEGMGIYLSILLRPDCLPSELMHLTCATAVAMCDALEQATGLRPGIKWTNDLVFGKKKLGGILTELGLTPQGRVDWAIIGIGINCRQENGDFPKDIRAIATSVNMITGTDPDPALLAAAMLTQLRRMDETLLSKKRQIMEAYCRDCVTIGQEVSVVRADAVRYGTALDVDAEGALVVRYEDGTLEAVNSGEVSIRGMYGYL
ncbi:MAG: biotin--[acetyl-CoA-carboxylase] ligase [Faecousia sp.]